jgi:hypothetical protein
MMECEAHDSTADSHDVKKPRAQDGANTVGDHAHAHAHAHADGVHSGCGCGSAAGAAAARGARVPAKVEGASVSHAALVKVLLNACLCVYVMHM